MRRIKHRQLYKGRTLKQVEGIFEVFEQFFNLRYFGNIYEIGSGNGAFSMWLAKKAHEMKSSFTTVDIRPIDKEVQDVIESFGGVFKNVEHKEGDVDEVLHKNKHNLLLIDGVEKVPPFKYFAEFLRPGDFMLTHDFYDDEGHDEYGTFTLRDVAPTIIENELIIKYPKLFDKTLWLCVTK